MPRPIAARTRRCQAAILLSLVLSCAAAVDPASRRLYGEPAPKIRAERYEIDVAFEPERGFLRAKATVTFRADAWLKYAELELNPHLEIKSVSDTKGALEFFRARQPGSPKFSVVLADPSKAGEPFSLTFAYEGVLPRGQLDYITKRGILLRDEARWYPAVDLSAFTENDMRITVPAGWHAISSGSEAAYSAAPATITMEWKTARPVSSRSVVAGPGAPWPCTTVMKVARIVAGAPLSLNTCASPAHQKFADPLWHKALDVLFEHGKLLGALPQNEMTIVEGFPDAQGAIGYSAPGFLVVSPDVLKYHDVRGYSPEFLPHEMAHQWFPINVTLKSVEDGWLAESLAEYLGWRYLREKDPEQARQMVARAMRDALEPEPLRPLSLGLKLFGREPWNITRSTLYDRGMLVFRTLETVIDRERVDHALGEFYKRYAGKSASIADFRRVCEEAAGRDLGWFFDYFIQGTRVPEIELRRLPAESPAVVAGEIVAKDLPPGATVRVEMRARTKTGAVDHSVATRGEVTPFTLNVPAPALELVLDPDARILRWTEAARRNRAQHALLQQIGALEASSQLSPALELCRQALALDPDDLATNQQRIRFLMGRLEYRQGALTRAGVDLKATLEGRSLDAVETDFLRAWSRVYRARIARRRGQTAAAQAEVKAGLALSPPALDSRLAWPEAPKRETSAREALEAIQKGRATSERK